MNTSMGLDRCLSFINCQLQPPRPAATAYRDVHHCRAITISRQAGSGAHFVAQRLIELLGAQEPKGARPWTVFDRDLVEKVLSDHHLPASLARFMPEDKISEISDTMDELFGLHPPSWTLVRKTAETILHLAQLGHVILIGRGANVITGKLNHLFHVRLIGSEEKRVKCVSETLHLSQKEALALVQQEDNGRKRFLSKYFKKDIEDPLLYHMILNTDLVPYEEAARLIADAVAPKTQPVQTTRTANT